MFSSQLEVYTANETCLTPLPGHEKDILNDESPRVGKPPTPMKLRGSQQLEFGLQTKEINFSESDTTKEDLQSTWPSHDKDKLFDDYEFPRGGKPPTPMKFKTQWDLDQSKLNCNEGNLSEWHSSGGNLCTDHSNNKRILSERAQEYRHETKPGKDDLDISFEEPTKDILVVNHDDIDNEKYGPETSIDFGDSFEGQLDDTDDEILNTPNKTNSVKQDFHEVYIEYEISPSPVSLLGSSSSSANSSSQNVHVSPSVPDFANLGFTSDSPVTYQQNMNNTFGTSTLPSDDCRTARQLFSPPPQQHLHPQQQQQPTAAFEDFQIHQNVINSTALCVNPHAQNQESIHVCLNFSLAFMSILKVLNF